MNRFTSIKKFFEKCVDAFPGFSEWMRSILKHRPICENCACSMHDKKFHPIPLQYSRHVACETTNYAYVCKECAFVICNDKNYYKIIDGFLNLRYFETIHGMQTVRLTPELVNLLPNRPILKTSADAEAFRKSNEYQMMLAINKKEICEECNIAGGFHPVLKKNVMGLKFVSTTDELTLNPKNYKTLCPECAKKMNAAKASV